MKISQKAWKKYLEKLNRLDTKASNALAEYFRGYDVLNASENDLKRLLDCAYALATYYGEGAGELACEMYDAIGIASGKILPPAEPAPTATYGEVAKAVQGAMLKTQNPEAIGAVVGTKVKTVGLDTMLKNSLRDGAEFAWVPAGDTCPFCMMLASNGWQRASKKALKNGHAEHVHNNCDCTYAIRFDENTEVEGYDPDYYKEIYDNAEGDNWKDKVNFLRREQRKDPFIKEKINAQKRAAYARANGLVITDAPMIDYTSAYTFANGDVDLMNALRSGNCQDACEAVNTILDSKVYGLPESRWSKKATVGRFEDMKGIFGLKEIECGIVIRSDRLYDIKTMIHENIHSRSYSRINKNKRADLLMKHRAMEEGPVEYLSQVICSKSHIDGYNSYPKYVNALKGIKKYIDPDSDDYTFAKNLIAIPLDKRYNTLRKAIDDYYKQGMADQSVQDLIEGYMKDLRPGKRVAK